MSTLVCRLCAEELQRGQRGTEADIVAVLGLVADMDGDTGKNAGEYPIPPNYVLETSPGNLQPFWLFDRPVKPAEAKVIARGLKAATGSDHGTADTTHVWRVPGTLNWPSKVKLDRGRSADPASVIVSAPWDGSLTDPFALLNAAGSHSAAPARTVVALGELPDIDGVTVSEKLAVLLAANDVDDRSDHAWKVVEQANFDGHNAETVAALFLSAAGNWLARYPTEANARKDFERLWSKIIAMRDERRDANADLSAGLVPPKAANDNEEPGALNVINPSDWEGQPIPERHWYLEGLIPNGQVTLLSGDGGTGKCCWPIKSVWPACSALKRWGLGRRRGALSTLRRRMTRAN